jgi:phosphoglycolate phosphatase-like HAD superfamily hydrolase
MTVAWSKPGVLQACARTGLLVLDIDGVLLDPRPSFYAAAKRAALWGAQLLVGRDVGPSPTDADVQAFKSAGGWNDDFDLAAGLAAALAWRAANGPAIQALGTRSSGGLSALLTLLPEEIRSGLDVASVRRRSAAHYAGRGRCEAMYGLNPSQYADLPDDGLWSTEPLLSDGFLLRATGFDLAFFTGRNSAEAAIAIERLGLDVPEIRQVVDDGRVPKKPAPEGLLQLSQHAPRGPMVFVGDSIDDQNAAHAYRARGGPVPLVFVRVVGEEASVDDIEKARMNGADVVTAGLDAFLRALPTRDRRDDV